MLFNVPEQSQEHGERSTAAPQAEGTTPPTRTGARRSAGGLRPSRGPVVQPKLRLGGENDHHEREADRIADGLAAAGTANGAVGPASVTPVGGSAGRAIDPSTQQLILDAQGQGRPLPGGERGRYERGLGADLSGVRLHTDQRAGDLNQRFGSSAFTTGNDIFFGHGEYDPASAASREVLTHELAHVAQQDGGEVLVQRAKRKKKQKKDEAAQVSSKPDKEEMSEDEEEEEEEEEEEGGFESEGGSESEDEYDYDALLDDYDDYERPAKEEPRIADEGSGSDAKLGDKGEVEDETAMDLEATPIVKPDSDGKAEMEDVQPTGAAPAVNPLNANGILVSNLDQTEMRQYLQAEGLKVPAGKPKAISVGVVAWNINHLKADDEASGAQGASFKPSGNFKPGNVGSIVTELLNLRTELESASAPLTSAAGRVVRQADQFRGIEKYVATRREASQFQRDIFELENLQPGDVVKPGVEAMQRLALHGINQAITVRAAELELIRKLNRIWKRLARLHIVLSSGTTEDEVLNSRTSIRKELRKADPKGNINHIIDRLQKLLSADDLENAVSVLKRSTVVDLATKKFFSNPAVNLVLINEMNLGIKNLEPKVGDKFGLSRGPVMLAKGQELNADAKSGILVGKQRVGAKQYEYYPALHRADDANGNGNGLISNGTFYVRTGGGFAPQDTVKKENLSVSWDKALEDEEENQTSRGIVVHRYEQNHQEFWAGVLHTTPAGKDLDRKQIWPQIEKPLDELNKLALAFKIPLLVGGDFYIPAEGIVQRKRDEMTVVEAAHMGRVKAWHFARNIFLKAAEDTSGAKLDKLITNVRMQIVKGGVASKRKRKGAVTPKHVTPYQPSARTLKLELETTHRNLWRQYVALVAPYINDPGHLAKFVDRNGKFMTKDALKLFAPGMAFPDATWNKTLAGGDITELDILRNYRQPSKAEQEEYQANREVEFEDPAPLITMQRVLKTLGYRVVPSGNPTNPKEHGRGENKMQLADLFLVNQYWKTARGAVVMPDDAKLRPVDYADLRATRTYWKVSDHSPTVFLGSTVGYDQAVHGAFDVSIEAKRQAVQANRDEWRRIGRELAGSNLSVGVSLNNRINIIINLLSEPLDGPVSVVNDVRAVVKELISKIDSLQRRRGVALSPRQRAALKELRIWKHPYYTTNFSED